MPVLIDLSISCLFNADRAGKALLFQMIDDVNQHAEELKKRGFTPDEIEDEPGKYLKISYRDPDGNVIAFGSVKSS
jgi:hypothetical protein